MVTIYEYRRRYLFDDRRYRYIYFGRLIFCYHIIIHKEYRDSTFSLFIMANINDFYNGVSDKNLKIEIQRIFDTNEIDDLKKLLKRRQQLNLMNMYLTYIFHFIQSSGILITSIASGYGILEMVWLGVSLNALATLINIIENNNNTIIKKMMIDIQKIKNGNYIDETSLFDGDDKSNTRENTIDTSIATNKANTITMDKIYNRYQ